MKRVTPGTMLRIALYVVLYLYALPNVARAAELEWFVMYSHGSDPTDAGVSDLEFDFVGGGATVVGHRVEVDLAIGRKAIACERRGRCRSTPGGFVSIRYYPRRVKR